VATLCQQAGGILQFLPYVSILEDPHLGSFHFREGPSTQQGPIRYISGNGHKCHTARR
jgi:hypothetical protein